MGCRLSFKYSKKLLQSVVDSGILLLHMEPNRLFVRRAELRTTQAKTAKAAGMGRYRCWQIENNDGPPATPAEQKAIAKALKAKAHELWPEAVSA
jgi:DNA-binding XRE family transcriptional regulator